MKKIFPHTKYVIIALLSLVPGLIIHWYFTYGDGKQNLHQLIDQYGSISYIPLSKAFLYDFHFTWLTYTLPCLFLAGCYWIYKYRQFKTTENQIFEPAQTSIESRVKTVSVQATAEISQEAQIPPLINKTSDNIPPLIKPKDGAGIR